MIGFERNGTIRIGFPEAFDAFKPDDAHIKRVAPGQLINDQFHRINVLPVMLNQVEHGFHFFVLRLFHFYSCAVKFFP
jgi:hypothetical protein